MLLYMNRNIYVSGLTGEVFVFVLQFMNVPCAVVPLLFRFTISDRFSCPGFLFETYCTVICEKKRRKNCEVIISDQNKLIQIR